MTKLSMFSMICTSMMLMISMMLILNHPSHPMFIIMSIIIYSIMLCLNMSSWKTNFIYSIMLFLMMISGLLIIFLYFSSLISNEQMTFNLNIILIIITIMKLLFLNLKLMNNKYPLMNKMISMNKENNNIFNINENPFSNIMNIYTYPYIMVTIMSMLYLLMVLFIIIKMSSIKSNPMRKMF